MTLSCVASVTKVALPACMREGRGRDIHEEEECWEVFDEFNANDMKDYKKFFLEILSVPTLRGEDYSLLFLLFAYELLFLIKQIHCIGDSLNFLNKSLSD